MAHKVHPKVFRIQKLSDWRSRWMSSKNFADYVREDIVIRRFFQPLMSDLAINLIEIERTPGVVKVILHTARPGMVIGRGGDEIEQTKKKLAKKLGIAKGERSIKIEVVEIKDPWVHARLVAQWAARQLERRLPHRRVLKQSMQRVMQKKEILGAKIEVAGRLGGTEISRREGLQEGNLPRQTLRADIDYARERATCSYGTIGVKVWLYKGEKER